MIVQFSHIKGLQWIKMKTERVGAMIWDKGKIWDKCPKFRKCGRDIQALMTSFPPFTSGVDVVTNWDWKFYDLNQD